ncbi:MAG TPA: SDR family oxidoreductase [Dehalococcoidales bacterium]|nr:SDR family oxidoreductase [Dehalococcoidales bacterium]
MDLGFKGKVALITGAGSQVGFGREIAVLMAKEGCRDIAVSDINLGDVEKTAAELKSLGCKSLAIKADITRKAEVVAMADKVLAEFGRIDILVNNAGAILHKDNIPLEEQDQEIWAKQIDLNLFGTMRVTQAVLPHMRKQKYGVIVNISSGSSHQINMGVGVYAMSKDCIDLFTRQLAMTEAKSNIRVNCVSPGPAPTNFGAGVLRTGPPPTPEQQKQRAEMMVKMFPLGRIGTGADIAYATAFLASDLTCNVTAQIFHVSGGLVVF